MLLRSKDIAYTGILMALGVLLVTLGGYFEGSTLFFLAAASFLTGVAGRNVSFAASVSFVVGTALLGFILAPQKLYCATFLGFCIYILAAEYLEKKKREGKKIGAAAVWGVKAVLYHVLLFLALFLSVRLTGMDAVLKKGIFSFLMQYKVLLVLVCAAAAEAFWLLFDRAYLFFLNRYGHYFKIRE